jgi:L-amino acid N-acyltransferase YncA
MDLVYRRTNFADPGELRFIAEIDAAIPPRHDSDFIFDEDAIQKQLDFLLKKVSEEDFFEVAVTSDNKVIGYHLVKKTPYMRDLYAGMVYTLWVSPECRKNGIGSTLKSRGEAWAKTLGLDHLYTWINSKNLESISLNQKMGYEITNYKLKKKI